MIKGSSSTDKEVLCNMIKKIVSGAVVVLCATIVIVGCQDIAKSKANELLEQKKSSKFLLEETLNNESIESVYLYSEPDECIKAIKKVNESFALLQEREDYIDTIIDKYSEYELAKDFNTNKKVIDSLTYVYGDDIDSKLNEVLVDSSVKESVENDIKELSKVYFLECLITSKEIVEESSKEQIEEIKEATYDKYIEKENSIMYSDMEDTVYELAKASETADNLDMEINSRGQVATITTPNGSKVEVEIFEYNGDRWANTMTMHTKKEFPDAKILAKADNRYNCHSYAWYQQSTSNPYWMNNPLKFVADGSYKEASEPSKDDNVIWAVKTGRPYIEHSGIVAGKDEKDVIVVSKWGQGPLVEHYESYSPYRNKTYYYNRKGQ